MLNVNFLLQNFLKTEMGLGIKRTRTIPPNFSFEEAEKIRRQFNSIDVDGKGFITLNDLRKFFAVCECAPVINRFYCKSTIRSKMNF